MTAQELKNSILQLAIQGKLVEQRAEEGTAKELIEQIKAKKEQLIKDKKIKKEKPLPEITEEEIPFDIPESWEWVRLGAITHHWGQKKPDKEFDYIDVSSIDNIKGCLSKNINLIKPSKAPSRARKIVKSGTILYSTVRPYLLNICIIDKEFEYEPIASTAFAVLHPYQGINNKYLYFILRSPMFINYVKSVMNGVAYPAINDVNLLSGLIPIPPLEEQKRIVTKIEELMPYVEQYDKAYTKLEAFNKKFPEDMQKSILQYAIQGKLVEQREEEGTAEELYQQIQEEKARLIKEGKIKKEKALPEITEDEIPFDIPESWKWVRLRDVVSFHGGYAYKSTSYVPESKNQIIRLGNVKNNKIVVDTNPVFISNEMALDTEKYKILPGDILFTMTGTRGKKDYFYTTVVEEEILKVKNLYLNQRVGCLRSLYRINVYWLSMFLKADSITRQVFATETGTANQGNIGSDNTMTILIPLPPLEEQKRIVAKIEEMLPYCQQLIK